MSAQPSQMRAAACGLLRNASGVRVLAPPTMGALCGSRVTSIGSRGASTAAGRLHATSTADAVSDPWADIYTQKSPGGSSASSTNSVYSQVYGDIKESSGLPDVKPADMDAMKFALDPSVAFWKDYNPEIVDDQAPLPEQLRWLSRSVQEGLQANAVFSSSQSAAFWAYHIARSGFFMVQGLSGLLAARAASTSAGRTESSTGLRLENLFRSGTARPIIEAFTTFHQDLCNIEAGYYKVPYDMSAALRHRQSNPAYVLAKGIQFVREAADTLARRDQQAATSVWLDSALYPDYYKNTFHYQTDGWFSERSASVYETSTETLFLGRQDAMQRSTLVPLARHLRAVGAPADGAGLKLLEVACGTGRFATYIKDNYGAMEVTCMDLSPFYLAKARENMRYWKSLRAPEMEGEPALYMQAAAENIAAEDESYDAVTCVYLFHELPAEIRRSAAKEMARVLKPGGVLSLTDSVQFGDRASFDKTLGNFSNFNEPYYLTYISDDLGSIFEEAGLVADYKLLSSSSKTLSFKKPSTPSSATADVHHTAV